jgi:cell wall-associated NlpC family hydrolase
LSGDEFDEWAEFSSKLTGVPYCWGVPHGGVIDCSGSMASPGKDVDKEGEK